MVGKLFPFISVSLAPSLGKKKKRRKPRSRIAFLGPPRFQHWKRGSCGQPIRKIVRSPFEEERTIRRLAT